LILANTRRVKKYPDNSMGRTLVARPDTS